jgi:hypothetical protein
MKLEAQVRIDSGRHAQVGVRCLLMRTVSLPILLTEPGARERPRISDLGKMALVLRFGHRELSDDAGPANAGIDALRTVCRGSSIVTVFSSVRGPLVPDMKRSIGLKPKATTGRSR